MAMQAQPTLDHQIICGNVERLLNDALERAGLDRLALQCPAINLAPIISGRQFAPDVAVLDADFDLGTESASTCYVAVEVLSASDLRKDTGSKRRRIEVKRETYQLIESCDVVVTLAQDKIEMTLETRGKTGWERRTLKALADEVMIEGVGRIGTIRDVYARTPILRAVSSKP